MLWAVTLRDGTHHGSMALSTDELSVLGYDSLAPDAALFGFWSASTKIGVVWCAVVLRQSHTTQHTGLLVVSDH